MDQSIIDGRPKGQGGLNIQILKFEIRIRGSLYAMPNCLVGMDQTTPHPKPEILLVGIR